MPTHAQDVPDETISVLIKELLEACGRIESRASSLSSCSATHSLIHRHIIDHLLPQCRRYVDSLKRFLSSDRESTSSFDSSSWRIEHLDCVLGCHKLILEALDIFDLIETETDPAEFDHLNAHYADRFIRRDISSPYNSLEATKFRRHADELVRLLAPQFGPSAAAANFWWGLPGTEHMLPDLDQILKPDVGRLLTSILEQFRPRYIHVYPNTNTPPYEWDNEAHRASGSYGVVRKAVSKLTGEVVAVKTLEIWTDKDQKLMLRELGLLEICDHPNLLQLVDAYKTPDNKIHLVTTPWAPLTLKSFLERNDTARRADCPWFEPRDPASDRIILRIMFELADGVNYLHHKSIKHKDIKPDNILLHHDESGEAHPIIIDFGVSKIYKRGAPTDYIMSTYAYLALEQLGKAESSLKSDIWQLGCCFAMILALACGGRCGMERLCDSFENTNDGRSCNIAFEFSHFMPALVAACSHQPHVLRVLQGMLELEPAPRWDIGTVRATLGKLLG